MDACNEGFKDIIIYYTGHAYKEEGLKGHWVCRNGEGISLKDVAEIFDLKHDSKSLTIISDCCYSERWIKDISCMIINPKNLTIISACADD